MPLGKYSLQYTIFTTLKITQIIVLDILCSDSYPNLMKTKKQGNISRTPFSKASLSLHPFHRRPNCWITLCGYLIFQISPKSFMKCVHFHPNSLP